MSQCFLKTMVVIALLAVEADLVGETELMLWKDFLEVWWSPVVGVGFDLELGFRLASQRDVDCYQGFLQPLGLDLLMGFEVGVTIGWGFHQGRVVEG